MFIGHLGLAFGTKKFAPKISLGTLFLASQFLDLLWATLVLVGLEKVVIKPVVDAAPLTLSSVPTNIVSTVTPELPATYPLDFTYFPFSHSFLMAIVWGALIGFVVYLNGHKAINCLIVGGLVVSHWVLDAVVHFPDLPLYFGSSQKFGFALWESFNISLFLEFALFLAGVALYFRHTYAKNKKGKSGIWVLVALLALAQYWSSFGPTPSSIIVLALTAQAQWLFVWMGYWVDGNRGNLKRID